MQSKRSCRHNEQQETCLYANPQQLQHALETVFNEYKVVIEPLKLPDTMETIEDFKSCSEICARVMTAIDKVHLAITSTQATTLTHFDSIENKRQWASYCCGCNIYPLYLCRAMMIAHTIYDTYAVMHNDKRGIEDELTVNDALGDHQPLLFILTTTSVLALTAAVACIEWYHSYTPLLHCKNSDATTIRMPSLSNHVYGEKHYITYATALYTAVTTQTMVAMSDIRNQCLVLTDKCFIDYTLYDVQHAYDGIINAWHRISFTPLILHYTTILQLLCGMFMRTASSAPMTLPSYGPYTWREKMRATMYRPVTQPGVTDILWYIPTKQCMNSLLIRCSVFQSLRYSLSLFSDPFSVHISPTIETPYDYTIQKRYPTWDKTVLCTQMKQHENDTVELFQWDKATRHIIDLFIYYGNINDGTDVANEAFATYSTDCCIYPGARDLFDLLQPHYTPIPKNIIIMHRGTPYYIACCKRSKINPLFHITSVYKRFKNKEEQQQNQEVEEAEEVEEVEVEVEVEKELMKSICPVTSIIDHTLWLPQSSLFHTVLQDEEQQETYYHDPCIPYTTRSTCTIDEEAAAWCFFSVLCNGKYHNDWKAHSYIARKDLIQRSVEQQDLTLNKYRPAIIIVGNTYDVYFRHGLIKTANIFEAFAWLLELTRVYCHSTFIQTVSEPDNHHIISATTLPDNRPQLHQRILQYRETGELTIDISQLCRIPRYGCNDFKLNVFEECYTLITDTTGDYVNY